MTRTIFKIEILALLVLMVAGCGGKKADDYAHQVLDRHGQDWKRVEAMVVSMREAVSSEAAVEELGAKDIGELGREAAHKAMVYGVSEVRRAKTAT
ncbi:MAG: hypothetical protein HN909_06465, partial [Phycisphaerales bacterium]|nr:hypothetical protein [Phycisphaerales bacterium]